MVRATDSLPWAPSPVPLVGKGCQSQSHTLWSCLFGGSYHLLVLKSWIPSFVRMPEALAPVNQRSCMAPMRGGPTLGVEGFGSYQGGQPKALL